MVAPTMQQRIDPLLSGEIISIPYIAMTLKIMAQFGIKYSWERIKIQVPISKSINQYLFEVESDWSATSYWCMKLFL